MRAEQTSFLFGTNAPFIEELYERYLDDANAVDAEWRAFFEALGELVGGQSPRRFLWIPGLEHSEPQLTERDR